MNDVQHLHRFKIKSIEVSKEKDIVAKISCKNN